MTETAKKPYVFVPEVALLEPLPAHQRKRFERALTMMHDALEQSLSWEQIAQKSAISPYHFHRQFSRLFGETPGHYLSRVRLQYAVFLLYMSEGMKVTDIAHHCGYSSSQAMAKVLKRELGITAKDLRQSFVTGTPSEASAMLQKLAHPAKQGSLEKQLAQSMPTELVWYPQRGIKVTPMPDFDWDTVFDSYGKDSCKLLSATPIAELEGSWGDITYTIGEWQVDHEQYDFFIPEGYYLCCEVYLTSDVAFIAAIESLFQQARERGYEVDETGSIIEMVRDVEMTMTGGATFAFQIPIVINE
ncbi:AraC family transcriptional regulator [Motilimonas pumila]|uniref:AraC family transcriptional regulator n=2 Tax=Motilimonas pumila TaxID=2303987 RepID=A0A418YBB1_9GAMM|nr:AraC family transcriptional regulator [Motilimonas pumila]